MSYPNAEDYVRAVQQPAQAFRVAALRSAVFDLHPLYGIPMPASGNAAVVFKAAVEGSDTALRFFIRDDVSDRGRYAALGRHFAASGLEDCVAHPTWVDDAITINGRAWPVIRMSWVDGRTLDAYVGYLAKSADTAALAQLAQTWRALVGRLQAAEFAHGDLQHGNVLVDTSSSLRLVDFDGSWIADLRAGPPPNETGHPNYQRTGRQWGQWMDTFPALVIYTALLGLSRRPAAWADLHNGENILFSAEDFNPPFRTRTWTFLAGIGDAEVDHAAQRLMGACVSGWEAADPLEVLLAARPRVELPARPAAAPAGYPTYGGTGAQATRWWEVTAAPTGAPASQPPAAQPPAAQTPAPAPEVAAAPGGPHPAAAMPAPPSKPTPGSTAPPSVSFGQGTGTRSWYGAQPPPEPTSPASPPAAGAGTAARTGSRSSTAQGWVIVALIVLAILIIIAAL